MNKLTHTDNKGKANMVDISEKPEELRMAKAEGIIKLSKLTLDLIRANRIKKGDVLTVAEIAGIQAAKQTPFLVPLCHPLQISKVDVKTVISEEGINVCATVICTGKTGVEMEALTSVLVALLTIYDMCKAVDKNMEIGKVRLIEKKKSGKQS